MRPSDTSPEAWKVYLEIQRRLTPGEKLSRALMLSDSVVSAATAGLRRRFPNASEHEIFLRSARQRLGPDLFLRVYGNVVPDNGPTRERAQ
jgi:hypothetical protein